MKNKNIAINQNELRRTRSRSHTPTQVLGNLLRNTSLISSSLNNSSQVDANLTRLNRTNSTSSPNQVDRQDSDDTDYEMDYETRETNRSQFANKEKKDKAWDFFVKIDDISYRCKICQRENLNFISILLYLINYILFYKATKTSIQN